MHSIPKGGGKKTSRSDLYFCNVYGDEYGVWSLWTIKLISGSSFSISGTIFAEKKSGDGYGDRSSEFLQTSN